MAIQELIVKSVLDIVVGLLKKALTEAKTPELQVEELLQKHVARIERWSREIQLSFVTLFMTTPVATDTATVPLMMDAVPRRFRGENVREALDEDALLTSDFCYFVLGDPGSGKTTTLKRLARRFFVQAEASNDFPWLLPILVIVSESSAVDPIDVSIARALGLPVSEVSSVQSHADVAQQSETSTRYLSRITGENDIQAVLAKSRQLRIGSIPVMDFVAELLNHARALVFVDGVDEAPASSQEMIWRSIHSLKSHLTDAKIIATCRSGRFALVGEGVCIAEIEPLSRVQIASIAERWLADSAAFLAALESLPYADVASRPLFLSYLLTLFRYQQRLPERPLHVYQQIVRLALEEWDRCRRLERPSRYSEFNPEGKLEFLAKLSYYITYRTRSNRFSRADLADAYQAICGAFQLPAGESVEVARELETHTGIIANSGLDQYEFSHLSIQEYLCAHYLVRTPHADEMERYLTEYPSPVAIAMAMSSEPTAWLSKLIFGLQTLDWTTGVFLSRLADERPYFSKSESLGLAVLRMLFLQKSGWSDAVERFLVLPNVRESVAAALIYYRVVKTAKGEGRLKLSKTPESSFYFRAPEGGVLPTHILNSILS